jgi:uncharacterized membrane protein
MRRYIGWKYLGFYWEGWRRLTFVEAVWVLGVVWMFSGIRYAIFWNPHHRYLYLLLALLGLLMFTSCAVYLRQKRRDTQERK